MSHQITRREALRLSSAGAGLAAVGALSAAAPRAAVAAAGDDTTTPLGRLKIAARDAAPLTRTYDPLVVAQSSVQNCADPIGATVLYPTPRGYWANPNPETLADIPQVWGWRRDTWKKWPAFYFNSAVPSAIYASWYQPVSKVHNAATVTNIVPCGLHFTFTGQAFEVLFAGTEPSITLVADGRYMAYETIRKTSAGVPLSKYNCCTRFDFGYRATRRISLYGHSPKGIAALAIGPQDSIQPWVRDTEPSLCVMADSYGGGAGVNWGLGGPFWEAASLLGIPHLDMSAIGGTGYSRNLVSADTFGSRLADCVAARPDLFLTAGGINDNNWLATPPLYNTAAAAESAFNSAVAQYYRDLRAALPGSVLVAMGPWVPADTRPQFPPTLAKVQRIKSSLAAVAGPWIFLDNVNGGWVNSAGASAPATGAWQTGTGKVSAPKGDGNGDVYISADGTHPTAAGNMYLGQVLATHLRAALLALP
jgi:lysophospholipase L1-like esterase